MPYVKNTWETGDVITAEKLNNLEEGVENASVFTVPLDGNALTKTWQEIYDAMLAGKSVLIIDTDTYPSSICYTSSIWAITDADKYGVEASDAGHYECTSPEGYPSIDIS